MTRSAAITIPMNHRRPDSPAPPPPLGLLPVPPAATAGAVPEELVAADEADAGAAEAVGDDVDACPAEGERVGWLLETAEDCAEAALDDGATRAAEGRSSVSIDSDVPLLQGIEAGAPTTRHVDPVTWIVAAS
jgi:hypothetical protein